MRIYCSMLRIPRLVVLIIWASSCLVLRPAFGTNLSVLTNKGPYKMYESSRALLIGNSKYDKPWAVLDTVPREIKAIDQELKRQGFESEVHLDLTSDQLQKVLKAFLYQKVNINTRLVVFFAGHGWTDHSESIGYLVPVDAKGEQAPDFLATILSMEDLTNWSYQSMAKHILFVFDSCFSGAIFLTRSRDLVPNELFIIDAGYEVRQFITAGSATDAVPAISDFAAKFVEGLKGKADIVKDQVITGNELGYWLKAEITMLGKQTPQYGSSTLKKYRSGDMLFAPIVNSEGVPPQQIRLSPSKSDSSLPVAVRSLGKPSSDSPSVLSGIEVFYAKKKADGDRVARILEDQRIPFVTTRPQLPEHFPTNAIACGPDIPIDAVKEVATSLIEGGVPIRAILRFRNPSSKPRRIELVSLSKLGKATEPVVSPPLSIEQVAKLSECPVFLHN